MHFTTTTEIARKGSKVFYEYDEAIVLNNNKNIGLLLGGELAQAVLDSGVLNEIRKQIRDKNSDLVDVNESAEDVLAYLNNSIK